MARVLVTGGGGFLGRELVAQCRAQGDEVRVLGRQRYADLEAQGIDCRQGDVSEPAAVRRAVEGVEVVYHTAALAGVWGDPRVYDRTNIDGTRVVLEACRAAGTPIFIHTSTPSVVAAPGAYHHEGANESLPYPTTFLADYPRTKVEAERLALAANGPALRTCALRPHLIFGAGDAHLIPRVIDRARRGRLRIVGDGSVVVDLTAVENAARAHLLAAAALRDPGHAACGKAYFISNGEPVQLWPWINAFLEQVGLRPITKRVSIATALRAGGALEWLWRTFRLGGEPPMTRFVAVMLGTSHWFDISAARRDLGYDPARTPMADATARLVAFYRDGPGRARITG